MKEDLMRGVCTSPLSICYFDVEEEEEVTLPLFYTFRQLVVTEGSGQAELYLDDRKGGSLDLTEGVYSLPKYAQSVRMRGTPRLRGFLTLIVSEPQTLADCLLYLLKDDERVLDVCGDEKFEIVVKEDWVKPLRRRSPASMKILSPAEGIRLVAQLVGKPLPPITVSYKDENRRGGATPLDSESLVALLAGILPPASSVLISPPQVTFTTVLTEKSAGMVRDTLTERTNKAYRATFFISKLLNQRGLNTLLEIRHEGVR